MTSFLPVFFSLFTFSLLVLPASSSSSEEQIDPPVSPLQQQNKFSSLPLSGQTTFELRQNALKGDFGSMMKLARFWLERIDREKQKTNAWQEATLLSTYWLKKAAESAHPSPQFYLKKLEFKKQSPSSENNWFDELKDIAESCDIRTAQGDLEAILTLMDYFGSPDQGQFDHWTQLLREKANLGESQPQADLARLLFQFPEFQKNRDEALMLATESAKQNNSDGMTLAGKIMISQGKESKEDKPIEKKGMAMLLQAARYGHIEALKTLLKTVNCGENGISGEVYKSIIKELCDRGEIDILTQRGKELVEKNIDAPGGLSMLSRAADQDGLSALDLLANYYQDNGYNVPESPEKSVEYASRLVAQNNVRGFIRMASFYERGFGVEKNEKKALEYILQAMQMDMPEAKVEYARLLMKGVGIPANPKEAFALLKTIEKEDSQTPSLHFLLGYMYEEGAGTDKDAAKAIDHYTLGAEAGDTRAMNNLASMYELGSGTPKDMQKAVEWYRKAAENGNIDARRNMKKINIPLTLLSSP